MKRLHLSALDAAALEAEPIEQPVSHGPAGTETAGGASQRPSPAVSDHPLVIEGFANPDGTAAGDWSAYAGLSPLEQRYLDGDR